MKTIGLIGSTLTGNHGAEALVAASVGRLRERIPQCRFSLFSYYPGQDRAVNTCPDVTVYDARPLPLVLSILPCALLWLGIRAAGVRRAPSWLSSSVKALDDCDVLLDLAGVSFVDSRVKFLPYNVATLLPAFILGIPVVKISQAMGPFRNPFNRLVASTTLRGCRMVFGRGKDTVEALSQLRGLQGRYSGASDIAFLHNPSDTLGEQGKETADRIANSLSARKDIGHTVVGICPSIVVAKQFAKRGDSYEAFLLFLSRSILKAGYDLLLIPNATRADSPKSHNNDLPLLRRVHTALSSESVHSQQLEVVCEDIDAGHIKRLLALCDAAIVSRFHAMVFCLTSCVPVIVVGWGHKYREVMKQFDLTDYEVDCNACDVDALMNTLETVLRTRKALSEKIAGGLPAVLTSAAEQIAFVQELLRGETADAIR